MVIIQVKNISELKSRGSTDGSVAIVNGYNIPNDSGLLAFIFNAESVAAGDDINIVAPSLNGITPAKGRWELATVDPRIAALIAGKLDRKVKLIEVTASRAIAGADDGSLLFCTASADITLTVPAALDPGFSCTVVQWNTGRVTFTPAANVNLRNSEGYTKTAKRYAPASLVAVTLNEFLLDGNLGA